MPAANPVADLYSKQVALLEHDLVRLAEAVPAEHYQFRPPGSGFDGTRTFGEQARHVATLIFIAAAVVLRRPSPYAPGAGDNGPEHVQGKDLILEYLRGSLASAREAASSFDEVNQCERIQTYFGGQARAEVMAGLIHHSYNHYGQMVVYARMNGIVPPAWQEGPASV